MKKKVIDISFIMPTYNRHKYLKNTLPQILKECSYLSLSYEIIIVDGGSTDDTIFFLKNLSEKNNTIKLIQLNELNGATHAFKIGFKKARGKYLTSMSDHDYIIGESYNFLIDRLNQDQELGAIAQKYYISGRTIPYKIYNPVIFYNRNLNLKSINGSVYLNFPEHLIFRRNYIDCIDKSFYSHWWGNDLFMKILLDGKSVGYSKLFNYVQIKIKHSDKLHNHIKKFPISDNDRNLFFNRYQYLLNMLPNDDTFFKRSRIVVFKLHLYLILKLSRSVYFKYLIRALNKLFIKRNLSKMQRVLFSKKLMQYTIQRLHFLKIESLIDKIYRLSSWYTIKNIKNDKTLFMIQRLPTSTIERYKKFNLNNK